MSAPHDPETVARYAAAVRAAVADLSAEERAQLLDDLEAHLQEVATEPGASLTERLGPPEAYAAELRAAYGAPPAPRRPLARAARRRWRWLAAIVAVVLVAGGGSAWWLVSRSGSGSSTGAAWSQARLQSEAAAGHVTSLEIHGDRTGTATDRGGVHHPVTLTDTTEALATEMVRDGVEVDYVQGSSQPPAAWIVATLLLTAIPIVFVAVLAALVLGVLWRLYRRLGPPTRTT